MHLDTNFLVQLGKNGSPAHRQAAAWITGGEPLITSSMAWAEFLCGPLQPAEEQACLALLHSIQPMDAATATLGASLFNATGRKTRSLPDCLIASAAILAGQPLATFNLRDFQPFTAFGLILA